MTKTISHASSPAKIYFSDFFDIDPSTLEEYGAFNVSLINDLPLFIDPFLLFDSDEAQYSALHDEIIKYVKFLRDVSAGNEAIAHGLLEHWFYFPEVKQNWLGFSKKGNDGSGLGKDFAEALHHNLHRVFKNFGAETITNGSHLEKLCLLSNGVGRDHLSDFTTNLIKHFLLDYTQTFTRKHIDEAYRRTFAVEKVTFDYVTKRWRSGKYELPAFDGNYVLLTPKNILTKDDAWINRGDLLDRFQDVCDALPNEQLRSQVSAYFLHRLSKEPTEKEQKEAAGATAEQFPIVLDYYIKDKEEHAEDAHNVSEGKVRETKVQFVDNVVEFVNRHLVRTEFYELGDSFDESLRRVHFLKDVIENNDGYRHFYFEGKPFQREADLQLMYRLTWFGSSYDVNREVNNGRGPVDYKISKGSADATLVEFKLASNSKLAQNLKHQIGVYEAANNTAKSIKVIMFYNDAELERINRILRDLNLIGRRDVVLIDASNNKISASNVRD